MASWPPPFSKILPIIQTVTAACFGGFGLWQRARYLNGSWLGWNSTERFHVWPWPFKFAVVTNFPAFLVWTVLGLSIGDRWHNVPEGVMFAPALFFVAVVWYGVGVWMDRRWGGVGRPASELRTPWMLLAVFTMLSAMAVFVRVQYPTSDYLLLGAVIWSVIGVGVGILTLHRKIYLERR